MPRFFQSDGASKGHPRTPLGEFAQKTGNVGSAVLSEAMALARGVKHVATQVAANFGFTYQVVAAYGGTNVVGNWGRIAYGAGLFVVFKGPGSSNNNSATSPDGVDWTVRTRPSTGQCYGLVYANGRFVAIFGRHMVGTEKAIYTSLNGITWTPRNVPYRIGWFDIAYGNGVFVAVAPSTEIGFNSDEAGGAAVVAPATTTMVSSDGVEWTATGDQTRYRRVCFGNGVFVAVCHDVDGTAPIRTSTDGAVWTPRSWATSPYVAGTNVHDIQYVNGLFVAAYSTGAYIGIRTSPDGITWTQRHHQASSASFLLISHGPDATIVGYDGGTTDAFVSEDANLTWTRVATGISGNGRWYRGAYALGKLVIPRQNSASVLVTP